MIDKDKLDTIRDKQIWQLEEMIKLLDILNYSKNEYLTPTGIAEDIVREAENRISANINSIMKDFNESYFVLALFLRESSYWFASEMIEMAKNTECPLCLIYAYEMYMNYCFYKTEKQEIRRCEIIEELREKLFEQYKHNRNVKDNSKDNIRILKLLTLIDEYEEIND